MLWPMSNTPIIADQQDRSAHGKFDRGSAAGVARKRRAEAGDHFETLSSAIDLAIMLEGIGKLLGIVGLEPAAVAGAVLHDVGSSRCRSRSPRR